MDDKKAEISYGQLIDFAQEIIRKAEQKLQELEKKPKPHTYEIGSKVWINSFKFIILAGPVKDDEGLNRYWCVSEGNGKVFRAIKERDIDK